jgi:Arc/MetJ-type ribon-helix-helix transcriptional regulator
MSTTETAERLPRRNLTLFASSQTILTELRAQLETTSDSEVVRFALRYLDQLIADQEAGRSLIIQPIDGKPFIVSYQSLKGREGEDQKTEKRNIVVNQAAIDRMEHMKRAVGVSSDSEIVRRSLRYLHLVMSEANKGSTFVLDDDGEPVIVRMDIFAKPSIRHVAAQAFRQVRLPVRMGFGAAPQPI